MIEVIEKFRNQICDRKKRKFYGAKTAASLRLLNEQEREKLKQEFDVSFLTQTFLIIFRLGFLLHCQRIHCKMVQI